MTSQRPTAGAGATSSLSAPAADGVQPDFVLPHLSLVSFQTHISPAQSYLSSSYYFSPIGAAKIERSRRIILQLA